MGWLFLALLGLSSRQEKEDPEFGLDLQMRGVDSGDVARAIARSLERIEGALKIQARYDDGLISLRFKAKIPLRPKSFESALEGRGKILNMLLVDLPGKAERKGALWILTAPSGLEYELHESDATGVLGGEEQLPLVEKRTAAGKPNFLISGRLTAEKRKDKAGKEFEAYVLHVSRVVGATD